MEHDLNLTTIERQMMSKAALHNIPLNGSIELLPLCNMNCDMCYVRLTPEEMNRQGRIRSKDEWLHIAKEMKESGVLYLLLTGGEPLLYPDFQDLYLQLQSMGMVLTLNTNGTLIDEDRVAFFSKNRPRRINITLYGASADSYDSLCHNRDAFHRVINGIKLLHQANIDVKLSSSITKKNVHELEAMHQLADELDVPLHTDTYMMPSVRERSLPFNHQVRLSPEEAAKARIYALKTELGEENWNQYRMQRLYEVENILPEQGPFHNHCHAGRCSFTLNWQGELHPCVILDSPTASVFEMGFQKAWEFISQSFCHHTMSETCSSCNLRPVCRTCLACAKLETGEYSNLPDYMCRYANASYQLLKETDTY